MEIKGGKEGEYTYIGARGESVIDYVITEERGKERIERMEMRERESIQITFH